MFSWMKKSETEVPDTDSVISSLQKVRILIFRSYNIVSQRSSLELASWSQKAGSNPQNLWPIL